MLAGWGLVVLTALSAAPGTTAADTTFAQLNAQGAQAYQEGRFNDAADLLQQAFAIRPDPVLLFNTARAYEKAGNDEQAARFYQRYLDSQNTDVETLKKAALSLDQARSRLNQKQIDQARARADADRAAQEKAAQEKADQDRAEAQAREQAQRESEAKQRAAAPTVAANPHASRPSLVPGITLAGLGGAAAVVGLGFGLGEKSDADSFNQTFDRTERPVLRQRALDSAHAADVCYGVAVVGAGVGVVLLVRALTWTSSPDPTTGPVAFAAPGLATVGWAGTW